MSLVTRIHGSYVFGRRVEVLSTHLASLIPLHARVLDVGCGDGLLARRLMDKRPDVEVTGIDVLVRPQTHIPVTPFDGRTIPHASASFDVVTFVDVLHHADDAVFLLREAKRVARQAIVLKDHTLNGLLAGATLRFMDKVGNERHGVVLPYNYWPKQKWTETFAALGLKIVVWKPNLKLYPIPARWVFERSLHFVARLEPG